MGGLSKVMGISDFGPARSPSESLNLIEVAVELYGMWRDLGGSKRLIVPIPSGSTLADLVTHLSRRSGEDFHRLLINPATGELWSSFAVAVNDALIERAAEMDRVLRADDRVTFLHPVAGGTAGVRDSKGPWARSPGEVRIRAGGHSMRTPGGRA